MDEQETPEMPEEQEKHPDSDEQTEMEVTNQEETPVVPASTSRRNVWHIVLIIIALIPLNYAIFVTLKNSLKPGDADVANSAEHISDLIGETKENPSYETFLNLGMAYYNAHQFNEAITAWKSALQYNPNSEVVYNDLGVGDGCLGKWAEMKVYCEKALAINPNFALAKNNLAWANDELAKIDPTAAKKTGPAKAEAEAPAADFNTLLNQGLTYYNQKQYAEAIKVWEKALQLNPNSDMVWNNMGAAYGCLSMWNEQIQCCQKALSINPNFQLAKNNLAWGMSELKKRAAK